jgi:large subunit ribosomal protein L24
MAAKIRKGDTVIVLAGKDKGSEGEVLQVLTAEGRCIVRGINLVKKHRKAQGMQEGGIKIEEAPIHLSNVAVKDPKTGAATRVGFKILADGRKVRIARKSGVQIDD